MNTLSWQEQVQQVADGYWELILRRHPTWATDLGDHRYDHCLPDYSRESREIYFRDARQLHRMIHQLPAVPLTSQPAVTLEVMKDMLEQEVAGEPWIDERWTVNPLHGPVVWLTEFAERQPLFPDENLERLLERFRAAPAMLAQLEAHLQDGLAEGTLAPAIGVERMAAQLRRMIAGPAETSAFIPHVAPEGLDEATFARIQGKILPIVQEVIYPAVARHAAFLEDYLPKARRGAGLCHLPKGDEYYAYLIGLYTGSQESPQTIHDLGCEELARNHAEMEAIALRLGGTRDIRAFTEQIRSRADQYLPSREALLEHNRNLLERAKAALPAYFSRLPSRPCEVRPVERFRELDTPSGFYTRAPDDGARPAYYYVNTHGPEHRPLYNSEALAFHEAVPGHHLQIALAQELSLPNIRRHVGQTAFIEGWALYSERLSDEMGLYSSELTRFGMLNYSAWRAARLVLDTGIHALGWTREQAIEKLLKATAHGGREATVEVDRYICMPAQALAYMLGRMEIDRLRADAQAQLEKHFDIKAFHAQILEHGAIPLTTLRHLVQAWTAQQRALLG